MVNQVGSPSIRVVITVDGREVLRHDDANGKIQRVFDKISIPAGSKVKVVLTANQPGLFTAGKDGLAHRALDGSTFFDFQQPALLHEAQIYAAKAAGGQRSLLHRMLCTRDNASSFGKQYSQIDMADIFGGYQCQDAYNTPYVWGLGGNEHEVAAFTVADNVKVVRDYRDNFGDDRQPGFSTLTQVFASNNNSVFEFSGTVQEDWKSLHIEFTHFEYAETHRFTFPLSPANQVPQASLSSTWSGAINGSSPVAGGVVTWLGSGSDPDGRLSSYELDFGDGSPIVGVSSASPNYSAKHVYAQPGRYVATLTVKDADGAVAHAQHTVNVRGNTAPVISTLLLNPGVVGAALSGSFLVSDAEGDRLSKLSVVIGTASEPDACVIDILGGLAQAAGNKSFSGCTALTSRPSQFTARVLATDVVGANVESTGAVVNVVCPVSAVWEEGSPNGSCVRASPTTSAALFDDFLASAIDSAVWNIAGQPSIGGGYTQYPAFSRINTEGKVTVSGDRIVIEARLAGQGSSRDTSIQLVDTVSGDYLYTGDTNYFGNGFFAAATGPYNFTLREPSADVPSSPLNVVRLGGSTNQFMEYRWTLDGDTFTMERGPTLANITQRATRTLGRSIVGRSFYLSIGTASASYSPGTWDWVRAIGSSTAATTGSFSVASNTLPGAVFNVPAGATSCRFDATGTWSAGPQADPATRNADGVIGGNTLNLINNGVPIPTAPIQALVAKRSSTNRFEMVGGSRTLAVTAGEQLSFMMNDATDDGYSNGNTGQLDVSWACR